MWLFPSHYSAAAKTATITKNLFAAIVGKCYGKFLLKRLKKLNQFLEFEDRTKTFFIYSMSSIGASVEKKKTHRFKSVCQILIYSNVIIII